MNTVVTKPVIIPPSKDPKPPQKGRNLLLIGIVLTFILFSAPKIGDYLEWDEDGTPKLSAKREKKLHKALRELEEAEQYALIIDVPGYYPCFNCDSTHIFMHKDETWRFGSTVKKQKGRYPKYRKPVGMTYQVQCEGNIFECKKQELLKIYSYPIMPENLKRAKPLKRPPGNKNDQ